MPYLEYYNCLTTYLYEPSSFIYREKGHERYNKESSAKATNVKNSYGECYLQEIQKGLDSA